MKATCTRCAIVLMTMWVLGVAEAASFPDLPDWLDIEAQLEIEVTREQNFDLAPPQNDTLHILRPELQFGTWLKPHPGIRGFVLLELAHAFDVQDDTGNDELAHAEFAIKEAFVAVGGPALLGAPLTLQVGRQSLEDERQWWYDEELDAVRFMLALSPLHVELSVARLALVDKDLGNREGKDDTNFYHLYAQYAFGPFLALAAYALALDDHQPEGERPVFLGFRLSGELETGWRYWLDVAHVRGKSEGQQLRGWGLDAGLLHVFDAATQPLLILSYAFGSGDDAPETGSNTNFRQTGLQGNEAPYESVTDLRYYGELFDPELSNLHIVTVGLGLRPIEDASVTVLYHIYRQHTRSEELRDAAIHAEPTGLSRDIGSEVDVIAGWDLDPVELKLVFGAFFPGDAFEAGARDAFFAAFRLTIEF